MWKGSDSVSHKLKAHNRQLRHRIARVIHDGEQREAELTYTIERRDRQIVRLRKPLLSVFTRLWVWVWGA